MRLPLKLMTAWRLGPGNVARVLAYRAGLRLGIHPVQRISAAAPKPPFFRGPTGEPIRLPARRGWWDYRADFGLEGEPLDDTPPRWLETPEGFSWPSRPWWQIPDFDAAGADIKDVWEASRFEWVLACAQRAAGGDSQGLGRLNRWLSDWAENNPPYIGPNWKCGQEASIRVLHLSMAAAVLRQCGDALPGLRDMVAIHLKRIAPTRSYAKAQDNNHGTSEAAALFVGGSWLRLLGVAEGEAWERAGRVFLEERLGRLVDADGTFSQYSTNYHRLLLDTLCMVELWRRWHKLPEFSPRYMERAQSATEWLRSLVCPETGEVANLGANDGARLLPLTDSSSRDFRPTVQLASALFLDQVAYPGCFACECHLGWLGVETPSARCPPVRSRHFAEGGLVLLLDQDVRVLFRYPRFRFRPSHSDLLHVDLWEAGVNVLRDGGTYRYAGDTHWHEYFSGTRSHNTIQFDDRDQMPRLGRFLFGAWPTAYDVAESLESGPQSAGAGYRDWKGAEHYRRLWLGERTLRIEDEVAGFRRRAVLRWRLVPGDWRWNDGVLSDGQRFMRVTANVPITRQEVVSGWESLHYGHKTELPVLEIEVEQPGLLVTELGF
jgi:hypothetical protein